MLSSIIRRCNKHIVQRHHSIPKDALLKEPKDVKYDMILADLNEIKENQKLIITMISPVFTYTIGTCIGTLFGFK